MKIRPESENDYLEVENLVRDSFWNVYRPGAFEHYIVHHLRDDESFLADLAYVIEEDGEIIGHINYSMGFIDFNGKMVDGCVLGPVSIHRDHQNRGLGSQLIEFTLDLAKDEGIPYVFVIGDENYYHRFGFESASAYNIFLDGFDVEDECPFFMVKLLGGNVFDGKRGTFHNPEVFSVCESDVDEFDRNFEYRQKLVLDSQLKEL